MLVTAAIAFGITVLLRVCYIEFALPLCKYCVHCKLDSIGLRCCDLEADKVFASLQPCMVSRFGIKCLLYARIK